jgi:MOSC domain-containing protein YiiM
LGQVLGVAAAAVLDGPTAASAAAVAAAVGRDRGDDPRAAVIVAGLRNPCGQINGFRDGLLKEVVGRDEDGNLVRKAGVMAVVLRGGAIRPGYVVTAELPPPPHAPLDRV